MLHKITRVRRQQPVAASIGSPDKKPPFIPCPDAIALALYGHNRRPEKKRLGSGWIHVSALVNGECLRAVGLAEKHKVTPMEKPMGADRVLWAIGKAIEAHIRSSLIDIYGKDKAYGHWECPCGQFSHDGFGLTPGKCSRCGCEGQYSELHIMDTATRLSGSPDMLLADKFGNLTVLELKSIKVVPKGGVQTSAPEFHTLEVPQRGHALQALLYRSLLQSNGYPVSDEVIVGYCAKDYVVGNPYKPFVVNAKADENELAVGNLLELARDYASRRNAKKAMDRLPVCPTCESKRAKGCPLAAYCFGRRDGQ